MINLKEFEWRWWSQHGEDGVIRKLLEVIPPKHKFFVEIGAHFHEANCLRLLHHEDWNSVFIDNIHEYHPYGFYKYWVTAENINQILDCIINVPLDFDIFSIDIDGVDFWVVKALDNKYKPRMIITEANPKFKPTEDAVIPYNPRFIWDYTDWTGASALAWYNLLLPRGYSLVHIESTGTNMFFVRNDLIPPDTFNEVNNLEFLWNQTKPTSHPIDTNNRQFLKSSEII